LVASLKIYTNIFGTFSANIFALFQNFYEHISSAVGGISAGAMSFA
jgi:hypothetical protein